MSRLQPSRLQVSRLKEWSADLLLGCRLTLSGGRPAWTRLALTGLGIGLAVCVLLVAASAVTTREHRDARLNSIASISVPRAGVAPLVLVNSGTSFRGQEIRANYVEATGPSSPVPPGISRLPREGEAVLSPGLAAVLASPDGALLRPRITQHVIGTITEAGLSAPDDLKYYAGASNLPAMPINLVYGFGEARPGKGMTADLWLLVVVGVIVLLFPVLVFAAISTRLSGAERDRRLSALRLIGASAHRVRRIAAGESLLGAMVGLVVGTGLFLVLRQFADQVRLAGVSVFVDDVQPAPVLAVLIAVGVPAMAVMTAITALRRTLIEPLGVVRQTSSRGRKLWWRLIPLVLGAALLAAQGSLTAESDPGLPGIPAMAAIVLLLLGIPTLLPWLVERTVGYLRGGTPSWQLATRRLQLDSGVAAKVVGGVAVLLAGAIALQTTVSGVEREVLDRPLPTADQNTLVVALSSGAVGSFAQAEKLAGTASGVRSIESIRVADFHGNANEGGMVTVLPCAAMRLRVQVGHCTDGDAFWAEGPGSDSPAVSAGQKVTFSTPTEKGAISPDGPQWTIPVFARVPLSAGGQYGDGLFVTPGAIAGVDVPYEDARLTVHLDPQDPDAAERVRNAVAPLAWQTSTTLQGQQDPSDTVRQYQAIRRALTAGSLITLLLAGASLLVLGLEQIRERRRSLAVLAATGVPRGVLARSLLWQNALPLLVATVFSTAVGFGLGALLLRMMSKPLAFDWAAAGLLAGYAILVVFAVALMTLPSLNKATAALGLRAE
ncbi:MAG: hypothetical protein JWQ81_4341 [Amycolatopsis sp.]|nr:hypothetical protein [Amycolatopsis sp.]